MNEVSNVANLKLVIMSAAVLVVCLLLALVTLEDSAEAAFPGKNGKIAFEYRPDPFLSSSSEIYPMNADGSNRTGLTNNSVADLSPEWSPDGSEIAFSSDQDAFDRPAFIHIFKMNEDGSNQTRLTQYLPNSTIGVPFQDPAWSPDGTKIAHWRETVPDTDLHAIFVMNADGSSPFPLLNFTDQVSDQSPDWQPLPDGPGYDNADNADNADTGEDTGEDKAPTIVSVDPADQKTGVQRDTNPTVTFSEQMDADTLDANVELHQKQWYQVKKKRKKGKKSRLVWTYGWAPVSVATTCGTPCHKLTIDPSGDSLAADTEYWAVVNTGAEDQEGDALNQKHSWTFTTGSA